MGDLFKIKSTNFKGTFIFFVIFWAYFFFAGIPTRVFFCLVIFFMENLQFCKIEQVFVLGGPGEEIERFL